MFTNKKTFKVILYVIVDKGGRLMYTSGKKEYIPEKYLNKEEYDLIALEGERYVLTE